MTILIPDNISKSRDKNRTDEKREMMLIVNLDSRLVNFFHS